MKNQTRNRIQIFFGVLVLAISGILIWKASNYFFLLIKTLNTQVAAALITGFVTITVATISILAAKYYESKRQIEKEIRDKKIPVYEELITQLLGFLMNLNKDQKASEEFLSSLRASTPKLIVWASDEVIVEWAKFRVSGGTVPPEKYVYMLEDLFLAIRKDIGHKNENIARGNLLEMFINRTEN